MKKVRKISKINGKEERYFCVTVAILLHVVVWLVCVLNFQEKIIFEQNGFRLNHAKGGKFRNFRRRWV